MSPFPSDPVIGLSHTADKSSFAYSTVRERWPKIISSARDDVEQSLKSKYRSLKEVQDGTIIINKLDQLLSDMAFDIQLKPLTEDGLDVASYNKELEEIGPLSWQNAPWLYLECFLYRLVQTFFSTCSTPFWKGYDVFANTKNNSIPASKAGTIELVTWFLQAIATAETTSPGHTTHQALMEEMLEISLWGNATDLSLLTTISMEELHSRQGREARQASKRNVIVDNTRQVWDLLRQMQEKCSPTRQIHIVLDNSGFELLADLVLAVFLLVCDYATEIILHGKSIPWFVSDVTARDLSFLVDGLISGSIFQGLSDNELENLQRFGFMIKELLSKQQITYEANPFWTTNHSFGRLAQVAPDLYDRLTDAELVIFKGDLNYRKLVADGMWPKITPFMEALGFLGKKVDGKAMRILALRGCKADVVVGLREGQEKELERESKEWTSTGKYAVISYWNAKDSM